MRSLILIVLFMVSMFAMIVGLVAIAISSALDTDGAQAAMLVTGSLFTIFGVLGLCSFFYEKAHVPAI